MNESRPIDILSLGAGVQSSTLALMATEGLILDWDDFHWKKIQELGGGKKGERELMDSIRVLGGKDFDFNECKVPRQPKAAIFADTQDEPKGVYRWLDWLESKLSFPVHRVTKGRLSDGTLKLRTTKDGREYATMNIPFFTRSAEGEIGKIPFRSCTSDYKIKPMMKEARKIGAIKRGQKTVGVIQWIGISLDEVQRMKPSRVAWAESRWPLVEMRMTRLMCIDWMLSHGYPEPPRSSCVYCPFHRNSEWRRLQLEEPEGFAAAVQFEKDVQRVKSSTPNFSSMPYLHRTCKPLDEIDFRSDVEKGQLTLDFGEDELTWNGECEGMCGV